MSQNKYFKYIAEVVVWPAFGSASMKSLSTYTRSEPPCTSLYLGSQSLFLGSFFPKFYLGRDS